MMLHGVTKLIILEILVSNRKTHEAQLCILIENIWLILWTLTEG